MVCWFCCCHCDAAMLEHHIKNKQNSKKRNLHLYKYNDANLPVSEEGDNELLTLEIIHNYVELLDQYFGSVCELDIIYNYEKVRLYFLLNKSINLINSH